MSYMVTQPNKGPPSPTGSERAAQPTIQPGLVLSFLLIENMLWKQQLCSLTSQEMVNINFGKIRKTAKNEAAGRKRNVFFHFHAPFCANFVPSRGQEDRVPAPPPSPLGPPSSASPMSHRDARPCKGQCSQPVGRGGRGACS